MSSRRLLAIARRRNREEYEGMRTRVELLADTLAAEGVDLNSEEGKRTLYAAAVLKLQRPVGGLEKTSGGSRSTTRIEPAITFPR